MRKAVFSVAIATLLLSGHGVAFSVNVSDHLTDSLSTGDARQNVTRNVVGGLLGSFLQKSAAVKTDTLKKSISEGLKRAGEQAVKDKLSNNQVTDKISDKADLVGDILGSLMGNVAAVELTAENIAGTWNFSSSKCVLESDNVMKKMGSELMVAPIEKKFNRGLERIGMRPGSFSYTFNKDGSYMCVVGSRTINGQYELDAKNKVIILSHLGGMMRSTLDIAMANGKLCLLYDSEKLLTFLGSISSLSKSATMKGLNSILKSYDGMKIGMEFSK